MSYSVQIERIGANGAATGNPIVQAAPSEGDALDILRRAIELALPLPDLMQFCVYGPDNRLLLNYTSGLRDRHPAAMVST